MNRGRTGAGSSKYKEKEPDLTSTGLGKNYKGFRIFHERKTDRIERIGDDYTLSAPGEGELARFRQDLAAAARKSAAIAAYIRQFASLRMQGEAEGLKPEPEGMAGPSDKTTGGTF
jgi:hypothetical protein